MSVLRPHLFEGVPLVRAAAEANVPLRTAQRWLAAYRNGGSDALARRPRSDRGYRNLPAELIEAVEGLALQHPQPSVAHIHRRISRIARERSLPAPSYSTVWSIIAALDPGLLTLAHEGAAAYRDRFELIYRREASRANEQWQVDHTLLDVMVLDAAGKPVRPWLTVVLDDYSRAAAGYTVFTGAPTALQTALALHQAVMRKADAAWPVMGLPDVLYSDHGSDFTSAHLEQVCDETHIHLIHSLPGVPQGRGKIERFYGTITTELLPALPGYIPHGNRGLPVSEPTLTLSDLDAALARFIVDDYNHRAHSETGQEPAARWSAGGWLPRMPASAEELDLLLLTVAKPRVVHRDGIHFNGLRYLDLTLSAYVGEPVTVRYDPRDLAEIRIYFDGEFLCHAISPELAASTISLKDIQTARNEQRKGLKAHLRQRLSLADALPPDTAYRATAEQNKPAESPPAESGVERKTALRTYYED